MINADKYKTVAWVVLDDNDDFVGCSATEEGAQAIMKFLVGAENFEPPFHYEKKVVEYG